LKYLFNKGALCWFILYSYTKFVVLPSKPASHSEATEFEYWPGYLLGFYTV